MSSGGQHQARGEGLNDEMGGGLMFPLLPDAC